jgi:hypothetical protein
MIDKNQKNLLILGSSLLIIFCLFYIIGIINFPLIFELKKAKPIQLSSVKIPENKNISKVKSSTHNKDTIQKNKGTKTSELASLKEIQNDKFKNEKILLIGDSQLEGLRIPIYGYCINNNYQLVSTVMWYGSSTKEWGNTDTLDFFIKKYQPSIVVFAIGLNELFVTDLSERKTYIDNIVNKFKKFGLKYFWIGPAAWTKDKGIINLMKKQVGDPFYSSHLLKLDRASDKRHPSRKAARIWFDSVAAYMSKLNTINFSRKYVTTPKIKDSPLIILSQVRY